MASAQEAAIDAQAQASADNWGRIHKTAYIAVLGTFWGITMLAFSIRLYVRIRIQKQFSWDDGAICVGVASFIAGASIMFFQVNEMFIGAALITGDNIGITIDIVNELIGFNKWSSTSLMLLWFSIFCAKLSFLLLFKKLVDRMRWLTIYWWFVLPYTVVVFLGGISSYFVPCPYFDSLQVITCSNGDKVKLIFTTALSQNIADIIGDCMILAIPIILISKIQVRWTQKVALSLSLCLTIVLIVTTIIRATGIKNSAGDIDVIWNVFWLILSTEFGLILSCALVFRTFFIGKKDDHFNPQSKTKWYPSMIHKAKTFFSKGSSKNSYPSRKKHHTNLSDSTAVDEKGNILQMPELPRATLTGMRTFIGQNNGSKLDQLDIMMTRSYNIDVEQV